MTSAKRCDLPLGSVPDYRTFVRHVWSYEGPHGRALTPPPVIYRVLFDVADPDWPLVLHVATETLEELGDDTRLECYPCKCEGRPYRELRFADLAALHSFCVQLGHRTQDSDGDTAVRVGEFVMWTLGFRWV